jgi:hypothetical protein
LVNILETRRYGITGNPDYEGKPFTNFAAVNTDTDLAKLNLNWREQDLRESERTKHVHRLHPYLGKFVPQLVEIFLRKYAPARVCDPFCGSGTTLVEAGALNIDALGCDVSPFNCLLSRVKTDEYDVDILEGEIQDILLRLDEKLAEEECTNNSQLRLLEKKGEYLSRDYLASWFAPQALRELLAYRSLLPGYRYADLLRVVLSRAARSARKTTHFDLEFPKKPMMGEYWCHKHRRTCRPTQEARKFLRRYSIDTLKRIREYDRQSRQAVVDVIEGDARSIEFPESDLVITSPPYVGLIDYHEQHRYAYELLGLQNNRDAEIGASWKGNSRRAVAAYVDDMTAVFGNVSRSMRSGSRMVVIIHDRRDLYDGIADSLGFTVEYRLRRHVNRRTGRRAGDFFEDVMVWRV